MNLGETRLSTWWPNDFNFNLSFSSLTHSCPILCGPMDCSTPGLPVYCQLPEFTQTHVHWVSDAIPTISSSVFPFVSCLQSFPASRSFQESALHIRWPKYWSFSINISPSMNIHDWFSLGWTGWISLQSKELSRVFPNTTVQKHQFFGAQLSL